ncbi:DUF4956 domain-containing protein [Verrucomicrobiaceae bacterium 227]
MKILIRQFLLLLFGCASILGAPLKIERNFAEKHPDAGSPVWTAGENGNWNAHFEKNGIHFTSVFKAKGSWIETGQAIDFEQLPASLQAAINLKHEGTKYLQKIQSVESATRGTYYALHFLRDDKLVKLTFDAEGGTPDAPAPAKDPGYFQYWAGEEEHDSPLIQSGWLLLYKVLFNILTIFVYAYLIYYRRHHDHKMLFLLLAFNLFLFPVFLSNSLVTAGFGFTIFALLALVRLRSSAFDKAEIAYLLGAISLTFVNSMLPIYIDLPSAAAILLTAFIADSPALWRDSYQTIEVDYRINEKEKMLDQQYLRKQLAEEYQVEVCEISINRVLKSEVRLTLIYRDLPELRKERRASIQLKQREEALKKFQVKD